MKSVDIMKIEDIDQIQSITTETDINIQISGKVCRPIIIPMEAFGRKIRQRGSIDSLTMTAILYIGTSPRNMDRRGEFLAVNRRNENRLDEQYQTTIARPDMDFRQATVHRDMITQIATVHQDTLPQIAIARPDMYHLTAIRHRGEHHPKATRRNEALGLLSDCIEIFLGKSRLAPY